MGKSALLDTIGTVGASRNEPDFTFLNVHRFRNPQANQAKWYSGMLEWFDGTSSTRGLDDLAGHEEPERVTYLPQQLIDTICSSDPGPAGQRFAQELAGVLFSHVALSERLNATTLDELIEVRSVAVRQRLDVLRAELARRNRVIAGIERRLKPERRQEIEGALKLLRERLEALNRAEPAVPTAPDVAAPEFAEQRATADSLKAQIEDLSREIEAKGKRQAELTGELLAIEQLKTALGTLEGQLRDFNVVNADNLATLGLELDDLITLQIHSDLLDNASQTRDEELREVHLALEPDEDVSLIARRRILQVQIEEMEDRLDKPSREYAAAVRQREEWANARNEILNGTTQAAGITQKVAELAELDGLPGKLATERASRREQVVAIHGALLELSRVFEDLYQPARQFIEQHPLASAARLEFGVSLVESGLAERFFDIHSRSVVGTFHGIDEGAAALRETLLATDFDDLNSASTFVESLDDSLHQDRRGESPIPVDPERAIRSGHELEELYDLVYGLTYLAPRYLLQYSGTPIEELSPGEKGTLLLMFYLLVDPGQQPLLLDQPDENLGNQTIKDLLVPAIQEASQRRQVVVVTHNPNVAVVADADQVIVASFEGSTFGYVSGSLESPEINRAAIDILEGTWPAFMNREEKYRAPSPDG